MTFYNIDKPKTIVVEFRNAYGGFLETRQYSGVSQEEYDDTFKHGFMTDLKRKLDGDAEDIASMSGEPLRYAPFADYVVVGVYPDGHLGEEDPADWW